MNGLTRIAPEPRVWQRRIRHSSALGARLVGQKLGCRVNPPPPPPTHRHTQTHTDAQARTHTHTHRHTQTHTHAHTQTQTNSCGGERVVAVASVIHVQGALGAKVLDAASFNDQPVVSSRPRTMRRAPHIYSDISGNGFQYHSSQLTFSDEWYCPQTCSPEDVGSTPGLSHSHRRVLTQPVLITLVR